jgi:hypothetical protein
MSINESTETNKPEKQVIQTRKRGFAAGNREQEMTIGFNHNFTSI